MVQSAAYIQSMIKRYTISALMGSLGIQLMSQKLKAVV